MAWEIVVEPQGNNPGFLDQAKAKLEKQEDVENTGGMIIYLSNGQQKQELSRVAYIRRNSKNPEVKFQDQLAQEVTKAREAVKVLNEVAGQSDAKLV
jgi:hypothetical protein